jgi:signal transduction histidine kinase/ABC-type uncharacterized transport system substrate-binding protein
MLVSRRWFTSPPERRTVVCPTVRNRRRCRNLIVLAFCLLFQSGSGSELKEVRRVAVFYELGLSSPAVALLDREMRAALENSNYQIELYSEFMETTLFDDPADQQKFRETYIRKYQNRRPDLIIALGPTPLQFMVGSHEKFFAGIPIVFGGTSEQQADNPTLDSHFTGCWAIFEPAKTLGAALRLQPDSKRVVVVGGVSSFDKHLEAIFRERLHGYEARLDFTYLTDLDMSTLLERLKHLPNHSIVLYTHLGMDAKGTRFVGASQAGPMIARAANAPVFGPSDVDLGYGEVGGYLHSFAKEGKTVGEIAIRILNGERPQDIPIVQGANAYMFDWRALRRWGFSESALPPGSAVLFQPPTFWQHSKLVWAMLLFTLLCLSAFILYVLYVRIRWSKEDCQVAFSAMLINAQGKERSRLASEIYDDFSQRHLKWFIVRFFSERGGRLLSLLLIVALIPTILVLDLAFQRASLGILYIIPMLLASVLMRERWIIALAVFCAILSWWGAPSASRIDGALYFIFSFISYVGVAHLLIVLLRRHQTAIDNLNSVEQERALRREAEERAKHRQMELSGMLINAQEKERSRLASEIHDDFSQRLALIALELETAEETIGTSPDEAAQKVHNVLNSASELGADLHTLSHRLHSSTLERLGLVPGVTALCSEFAAQQGIEVDLLTDGLPDSVNTDVALCLFRIIQEGLRNLKKHSGASKAQVRLSRVDDKLLVKVHDEGVGFDVRDLEEKDGLGIRSMEERADLLGGRFEIHSKPGKGTTIEAWVPVRPKPERRTGMTLDQQ